MENNYLQLEAEIIKALKEVYDPEIPVNVYDLGLIYKIDIDDDINVEITMTLTAPNCPIADQILSFIKQRVEQVPTIKEVTVTLVFDPPWSMDNMSDEARLELGYM